jgi:hypothetical protein
MNIGKTVKKIAALAAGATMLGATIMGATALDLSNYPAPFVTNGVWDGKIVVGANAATSDVVGAIDLAAALQADAATTSEVNVPGAAGTATVVGDSAEFKAGSDILTLGEALSDVKETFGEDDLEALESGVLDTGAGTTPVKQYLKFEDSTAEVVYEPEGEDDVLADYLYFDDGDVIFEYHMEFTESAISEIDGDDLPDLEGEVLNILGAPYTIVDATVDDLDITLKLMGGEVADVLRDGETKSYDIDGKTYEVTAVFIDSDVSSAKLSVNGVMTKELEEGDTQVLGSDVTVGVQEILTNQREGLVEFYLGANKLELSDDDFTDTDYAEESSVKIGSTSALDNVDFIIKATNTSDELRISYIKYQAVTDTEYWIPAGKGLKEFLEEPEVLLTETWDIVYAGMMKTGSADIEFNSVSDEGYKLTFTNVDGDEYIVPYLHSDIDDYDFAFGSDDDRLIYTEYNDIDDPNSINDTFISDDAYFVVSDKETDADTVDDAITRVLRYKSITTSSKVVTFEDLAGSSWSVSYIGTPGTDAEGDLIVDGKTHKFYVGDESATDAEDYALSIDLDADGDIVDATQVYLVAHGGAIIDLGAQTFTTNGILDDIGDDGTVDAVISTPVDLFDEDPGAAETIEITFTDDAAEDEVSLDVTVPDMQTDDANDNYDKAMTNYGAYVEVFNPESGQSSMMVEFPLVQRGVQVFVTAGTVEVKEGSTTSGGAITTTTVNPIAVGLAVLDTEAPAIGSKNMIVVGGPCINTVAAALMGNQADCTAGFEAGKAIIKMFADKNALLVAGYSAQDTLGACRVLAKYEMYDLSGTEVEVIAADLSALSVNTVQ